MASSGWALSLVGGGPWGTGFAGWGRSLLSLVSVRCWLSVGAALLQSEAKRLLAYHSVSQMGYILLGLGIGLELGTAGELGLFGAIYHLFNHALFKARPFPRVGVIYFIRKKLTCISWAGCGAVFR